MSRIVLKGEPKKFLKVTPDMILEALQDALPSGICLSCDGPEADCLCDSYFGYCDLSDLDLSGFHMRGVSIYRSIAKRVIFPGTWAKMRHFYSRCHYEGGDPRPYEGAQIPADRPVNAQHDMVVEILYQAADGLEEPDASHVRAVAELMTDYENGCYETGVELAVQRMGSVLAVERLFAPIFIPYPKLLKGFCQQAKAVRRD